MIYIIQFFMQKKGQINMKKIYLETFNSLIMKDIQFSFFIKRHIMKKVSPY